MKVCGSYACIKTLYKTDYNLIASFKLVYSINLHSEHLHSCGAQYSSK